MSCIRLPVSSQAALAAALAAPLPFTTPEKRKSKIERLWRLGFSEVASIRASAAGNPDCPARLMEILVLDPESEVRAWVCRNFKVSRRLLKRLAEDIDPGIAAYALFRLKVLGSLRP